MTQAVAEAENATLEVPDNAVEVGEPQELEDTQVAETEDSIEDTTESEAPETETEPEAPVDPFAGLDDDRLKGHERIQALIRDTEARARESERQKTEAATAKRMNEDAASHVTRGALFNNLNRMAYERLAHVKNKLANGDDVDATEILLPQQALQAEADKLYQYVNSTVGSQWEAEMEHLSPLEKLPAESREKVEAAALALRTGRKTMSDYFQTRLEAAVDAAIAEREPELRKKWQAEAAKTAKKEAEVNKQRADSATRKEATSPSSGRGDGITDGSMEGAITQDAMRKAFASKYGIPFDSI